MNNNKLFLRTFWLIVNLKNIERIEQLSNVSFIISRVVKINIDESIDIQKEPLNKQSIKKIMYSYKINNNNSQ